jgi:dihydropteroate synthase
VGVLRLGRQVFEPEQLLVITVVPSASEDPAVALERVHAVVAEGADVVCVSAGVGDEVDSGEEIRRVVPFVAAVRDAYPELAIGVSTGRAEVARAAGADLADGSGSSLAEVDGSGSSLAEVDGSGLSLAEVDGSGLSLAEVAASSGSGLVCALAEVARAVEAGVEPERIIVELPRAQELEGVVATGWPVLISLTGQELAENLATAAVAGWLGARVFRVDQVRETRRALRMVSAIRGDIPPAYAVRGLA